MRRSLEALAGWRREGLADDEVRGERQHLQPPARRSRLLAERIRARAAGGRAARTVLRLEITESTLMQEPERMPQLVEQVCATGVGLHLDDFGTGYSSLAALHRFPVEALKIDRSFVAALEHDAGSEPIVRSTIALAHSLGLAVIAEGIEEERQLGAAAGAGLRARPGLPASRGRCRRRGGRRAAARVAVGAAAVPRPLIARA